MPARVLRTADVPGRQGVHQLRMLLLGDHGAYRVLGVCGVDGGRPGLRHAHQGVGAVDLYGDPEQEVGEGQVGHQLPLRHQPLQVVDAGAGEPGVFGQEVAQRRHGSATVRR